jgi:hypothetical protein
VNLIGRGYPAPRQKFHWCTERLKIRPSHKFIRDVVRQNGEAILVLGTRKAESQRRAATMAEGIPPREDAPSTTDAKSLPWPANPVADVIRRDPYNMRCHRLGRILRAHRLSSVLRPLSSSAETALQRGPAARRRVIVGR